MTHPFITLPPASRTLACQALRRARDEACAGTIAKSAIRHEAKLWAWAWSLELRAPQAGLALLAMNYLSDELAGCRVGGEHGQ